jgi:hypothetical protein
LTKCGLGRSFQVRLFDGLVAQLVEQRTENPCVGGSIPSQATIFLFSKNGRQNNKLEIFKRPKI